MQFNGKGDSSLFMAIMDTRKISISWSSLFTIGQLILSPSTTFLDALSFAVSEKRRGVSRIRLLRLFIRVMARQMREDSVFYCKKDHVAKLIEILIASVKNKILVLHFYHTPLQQQENISESNTSLRPSESNTSSNPSQKKTDPEQSKEEPDQEERRRGSGR